MLWIVSSSKPFCCIRYTAAPPRAAVIGEKEYTVPVGSCLIRQGHVDNVVAAGLPAIKGTDAFADPHQGPPLSHIVFGKKLENGTDNRPVRLAGMHEQGIVPAGRGPEQMLVPYVNVAVQKIKFQRVSFLQILFLNAIRLVPGSSGEMEIKTYERYSVKLDRMLPKSSGDVPSDTGAKVTLRLCAQNFRNCL